ncbi:Aste57867_24796 [Aphanomyces stellatus]|uniref:Aste57867_24796 protein n=1 Tax=Aphanomyces stellatus TaxID=120398 RepID=A0A485LSU7_9STRA|nr:hypothetical protein As57867_024718 [Aphanomyces stellatus]VFU01431.1 Aste57867_24796 [Aphanomyces stellatus]
MWGGNSEDDAASPSGSSSVSRAELNFKEKQRMLKLNVTIDNLRKDLDAAGISSKMNKQSILDNTVHYIAMLQNDVVIAKQKAEFSKRAAPTNSPSQAPFERYFELSSTPKLIITTDIEFVRANHAFRILSGYTEEALRQKETLLACLSTDTSRVQNMVRNAINSKEPVRSVVENAFATTRSRNFVIFTAIVAGLDGGAVDSIEIVVTPLAR